MNLLIISLIYLSILRLMYLPFAGSNSHWVSAIFSILLAGIMFVFFKIDKSKVIIIYYSLILYILNLVSFGTSLDLKIVSYFETITPFILLGSVTSKRFLDYLRNNIKFFKNALIILILILLFGHLIQLLGFPLPSISGTPLTKEISDSFIVNVRITSFVGVSGPYSLSICYLLIALQILKPKIFYPIFIFGSIAQLLSFSRLGLTIFLIFNFTIFLFELLEILSLSFKNGLIKKRMISIFSIFIFIILTINFNYGDQLNVVFNRFVDGFTYKDMGNISRLERFLYLVVDFKENNIMNILIGDGTGVTARSSGAPQGESQIGKIFVEWGLLGVSLVLVWILDLVGILKFRIKQVFIKSNIFKLALFIALLSNLILIQAFTSSPIFVSMLFPLIAIKYREITKDDIKVN